MANLLEPLPIPNREVKPVRADGTAYSGRVGSRRPFKSKRRFGESFSSAALSFCFYLGPWILKSGFFFLFMAFWDFSGLALKLLAGFLERTKTAEFSSTIRMLFSSEGEYIVRVMRCAIVVFICVSLHPSLWRKLSIPSSRMACRQTHSAPISRASVCWMLFTSTRCSAFWRDSSMVAFTASMLPF